jgi:tRNA pseudouridine13 synthase
MDRGDEQELRESRGALPITSLSLSLKRKIDAFLVCLVVWGGFLENRLAEERRKLASLPPFIHFTLLKLNKESHDAISTLSRYFNVTPRELGLAGTKDKRAITVQRVSLKRGKNTTVEDVWKVAKNGASTRGGGGGGWTDRNVRIGDVEYAEKGLELGMLKGNKFVVTLRSVFSLSVTDVT